MLNVWVRLCKANKLLSEFDRNKKLLLDKVWDEDDKFVYYICGSTRFFSSWYLYDSLKSIIQQVSRYRVFNFHQ